MSTSNRFEATTTALRSLVTLGMLLSCHTLQAEQPSANFYNMTAFEDEAQGKQIVAGQYASAIATLTNKAQRKRDRFFVSSNLCVAYVKTKDAINAKAACDTAVDSAAGQSRRDRAVARSNRGVVLALIGDLDGAEADFKAALELRHEFIEPTLNLTRLASKQLGAD